MIGSCVASQSTCLKCQSYHLSIIFPQTFRAAVVVRRVLMQQVESLETFADSDGTTEMPPQKAAIIIIFMPTGTSFPGA